MTTDTRQVLVAPDSFKGTFTAQEVAAAIGRGLEAGYVLLEDGGTAVVEVAEASGLSLVAEEERDPIAATTYGTGQLIAAAVAGGAQVVLVCVGGSATTDGGRGAIDAIEEAGGIGRARIVCLCDVRTPFERAPIEFGPQKGADADAIRELEARQRELAKWLPLDPTGV